MGKTIVISNQKGGCGKSMTAANLAVGLARKGGRVLLLDLPLRTISQVRRQINPPLDIGGILLTAAAYAALTGEVMDIA